MGPARIRIACSGAVSGLGRAYDETVALPAVQIRTKVLFPALPPSLCPGLLGRRIDARGLDTSSRWGCGRWTPTNGSVSFPFCPAQRYDTRTHSLTRSRTPRARQRLPLLPRDQSRANRLARRSLLAHRRLCVRRGLRAARAPRGVPALAVPQPIHGDSARDDEHSNRGVVRRDCAATERGSDADGGADGAG